MTEHSNNNNCISQDGILKMHNIVVHDAGLTIEEIRNVWNRVGNCIRGGNVDGDKDINPMSACADEFDLNSMVAGAMILTLLICVEMDMPEGEKFVN